MHPQYRSEPLLSIPSNPYLTETIPDIRNAMNKTEEFYPQSVNLGLTISSNIQPLTNSEPNYYPSNGAVSSNMHFVTMSDQSHSQISGMCNVYPSAGFRIKRQYPVSDCNENEQVQNYDKTIHSQDYSCIVDDYSRLNESKNISNGQCSENQFIQGHSYAPTLGNVAYQHSHILNQTKSNLLNQFSAALPYSYMSQIVSDTLSDEIHQKLDDERDDDPDGSSRNSSHSSDSFSAHSYESTNSVNSKKSFSKKLNSVPLSPKKQKHTTLLTSLNQCAPISNSLYYIRKTSPPVVEAHAVTPSPNMASNPHIRHKTLSDSPTPSPRIEQPMYTDIPPSTPNSHLQSNSVNEAFFPPEQRNAMFDNFSNSCADQTNLMAYSPADVGQLMYLRNEYIPGLPPVPNQLHQPFLQLMPPLFKGLSPEPQSMLPLQSSFPLPHPSSVFAGYPGDVPGLPRSSDQYSVNQLFMFNGGMSHTYSDDTLPTFLNAAAAPNRLPAHKPVRLTQPKHPLAPSGTPVYFKYGEEHYPEETVPPEYTFTETDGTACRYITNFLVYNKRGERLLPIEVLDQPRHAALILYGSLLPASIMYPNHQNENNQKNYQSDCVTTPDSGQMSNGDACHKVRKRNTSASAQALSKRQANSRDTSRAVTQAYPVRVELAEWCIDYGHEPTNVPFIWLISRWDVYYRLEKPAGRYISTFATAKHKFEISTRVIKTLQYKPTTSYAELVDLLSAATKHEKMMRKKERLTKIKQEQNDTDMHSDDSSAATQNKENERSIKNNDRGFKAIKEIMNTDNFKKVQITSFMVNQALSSDDGFDNMFPVSSVPIASEKLNSVNAQATQEKSTNKQSQSSSQQSTQTTSTSTTGSWNQNNSSAIQQKKKNRNWRIQSLATPQGTGVLVTNEFGRPQATTPWGAPYAIDGFKESMLLNLADFLENQLRNFMEGIGASNKLSNGDKEVQLRCPNLLQTAFMQTLREKTALKTETTQLLEAKRRALEIAKNLVESGSNVSGLLSSFEAQSRNNSAPALSSNYISPAFPRNFTGNLTNNVNQNTSCSFNHIPPTRSLHPSVTQSSTQSSSGGPSVQHGVTVDSNVPLGGETERGNPNFSGRMTRMLGSQQFSNADGENQAIGVTEPFMDIILSNMNGSNSEYNSAASNESFNISLAQQNIVSSNDMQLGMMPGYMQYLCQTPGNNGLFNNSSIPLIVSNTIASAENISALEREIEYLQQKLKDSDSDSDDSELTKPEEKDSKVPENNFSYQCRKEKHQTVKESVVCATTETESKESVEKERFLEEKRQKLDYSLMKQMTSDQYSNRSLPFFSTPSEIHQVSYTSELSVNTVSSPRMQSETIENTDIQYTGSLKNNSVLTQSSATDLNSISCLPTSLTSSLNNFIDPDQNTSFDCTDVSKLRPNHMNTKNARHQIMNEWPSSMSANNSILLSESRERFKDFSTSRQNGLESAVDKIAPYSSKTHKTDSLYSGNQQNFCNSVLSSPQKLLQTISGCQNGTKYVSSTMECATLSSQNALLVPQESYCSINDDPVFRHQIQTLTS